MHLEVVSHLYPTQHGDHISEYLDNPGDNLQRTLAKIGIEVLLDMVRERRLSAV